MQDFERQVRRDDYAAHVASLIVAGVAVLVSVLFESLWPVVVGMGGGLVAAGVFAIRGGRSAIRSIAGPGFRRRWSTRQLENMAPSERASHARLTGGFLVVFGLLVWIVGGYLALR